MQAIVIIEYIVVVRPRHCQDTALQIKLGWYHQDWDEDLLSRFQQALY